MSIRVYWSPVADADIASYNVERAAVADGSYVVLANIVHNLAGPNYDGGTSKFFYEDAGGVSTHWYRIVAIDAAGQHSSPSVAFQVPEAPVPPASTVKVDHHYGAPNALTYLTSGGAPIEAADVRLYKKTDFDLGLTDAPIARVMTTATGQWNAPVYLETGYTYVVLFNKTGLYGPDKAEIVV